MSLSHEIDTNLVGQVFNIQRYSTHDGPGIRTTVFLKGCPLRCTWCQNPESQTLKPTLMFRADHCTVCGKCVVRCPAGANSIVDDELIIDREKCTVCGACTAPGFCLAETRKVDGEDMTVQQVMNVVVRDYNAYQNSGGGMTISGGDCEMQPAFTEALLRLAHENLINTCVEITGAFPWKVVKRITDHADYILFDLKHIDDEKHKAGTGVSNKYVLENAKHLAEEGKWIRFRTPLIPGFNDSLEDIEATARFIKDELGLNPAECLELLPYNNLGEEKYARLGHTDYQTHKRQSDEYVAELKEVIASVAG